MALSTAALGALLLALAWVDPSFAVTGGQADDFEDGTVRGWGEGSPSPNPPTNVADGGPLGAGDNYLRNVSGGLDAGSRMVMFNTAQWSGNYNAAGVTRVRMDLKNMGSTPLDMRLGFEGALTRVVTPAVSLPADGSWHPVTFDLSNLIQVEGTTTPDKVLANVISARILSATLPGWRGDEVEGALGVDNITALTGGTPVEASTWGSLKAGRW